MALLVTITGTTEKAHAEVKKWNYRGKAKVVSVEFSSGIFQFIWLPIHKHFFPIDSDWFTYKKNAE